MSTREFKSRIPSIYIQAAFAALLIQLLHKFVHEIPTVLEMGGIGAIVVPICACLLIVGMILLLVPNKGALKWGLILGIMNGGWIIFQTIFVHVIQGKPNPDGIWWYLVFPIVQGIIMLYFCLLAWKEEL